MFDEGTDGTTPVDPDEAEHLLPAHIRTREELDVWEQRNILEAASWALGTRVPVLAESTIRELHRRMFDKTWAWAGRYRTSDKNIGMHWAVIPQEVRKLVEDGRYWLENATYSEDEAAVRLHHRMVKIHLFPNGNGRHARLWCDMLLGEQGRPPIAWKNRKLDGATAARRAYLGALRAADGGDLGPLLALTLTGRDK